jgi:hypothetical protein
LVRLLCALDEGVELDEGVRSACRREVLLRLVCGGEFAGEVGEVCEGEFARVGAVAYAYKAELALDKVAGVYASVGVTRSWSFHMGMQKDGLRQAYWYV